MTMRILNSFFFWGLMIASVFMYFIFVATAPADASDNCSSMEVGCFTSKADRCIDLPGTQRKEFRKTDWRNLLRTEYPHDCRLVNGPR